MVAPQNQTKTNKISVDEGLSAAKLKTAIAFIEANCDRNIKLAEFINLNSQTNEQYHYFPKSSSS